jgi:hypothetical protein
LPSRKSLTLEAGHRRGTAKHRRGTAKRNRARRQRGPGFARGPELGKDCRFHG